MNAWTSCTRRERALFVTLGLTLLYGIAVILFFFGGRKAAWDKARKAYGAEAKRYADQKALIAQRAEWERRAEEVNVKMPRAGEEESTQTRWQRILWALAKEHNVALPDTAVQDEEEHGGVYEMPIVVTYTASLERLVDFLFALENAKGAMFDVREISIKPKKDTGYLSGRITLTCAYMKEDQDD